MFYTTSLLYSANYLRKFCFQEKAEKLAAQLLAENTNLVYDENSKKRILFYAEPGRITPTSHPVQAINLETIDYDAPSSSTVLNSEAVHALLKGKGCVKLSNLAILCTNLCIL